jgi:hypothetical protein
LHRCIEVGAAHVGCTEDPTTIIALVAAIDHSMEACRLFS